MCRNSDNIGVKSSKTSGAHDYGCGIQTASNIDIANLAVLATYAGGSNGFYEIYRHLGFRTPTHQTISQWQPDLHAVGARVGISSEWKYLVTEDMRSWDWSAHIPYGIRIKASIFGGYEYFKIIALGYTDDISGLSSYGETEAAIISNYATITQDQTAMNYLASVCTGSLMWKILANDNFRAALLASPYFSIIQSNACWAKALAPIL